MDISAGLIAKGTAGALAASAAVGTGIIAKNNGWLDFNNSVSVDKPQEEQVDLTKFDQGLIDFLKIDGGDIVFEVKKGGKPDVDLTEADFTFDSSNNKTLPLTAKVTVNTRNTNNLKEKNGNTDENGKITTLQKLNGGGANSDGTAWAWTCKVKLEAKGVSSVDGKTINDRDKIFKSTDQGLFGLLKKGEVDGSENATKKAKEKFIRFCAKERGTDKNKEINTTGIPADSSNNLKSEITINLKVGAAGQDENKLYPTEKDDGKFNELFG